MKKFFDRLFGVHPFLRNKFTSLHCMVFAINLICFVMYVDAMGDDHEIKYGAVIFFLLGLDIAANFWQTGHNQWQEYSRYEIVILEACNILFLAIIPMISLNQFFVSDIGAYFVLIVFAMPLLYIMPGFKDKFGRENLYITILKGNLLLNLMVSIRTTFFGICCCMALLTSWSMKNRASRIHFILKALTSYFLYLALVNCPIPICELSCSDSRNEISGGFFGSSCNLF